jgi:hypothetical protein
MPDAGPQCPASRLDAKASKSIPSLGMDDIDSHAAFGRSFRVKGDLKLMTQPRIAVARITKPTIAKATVTAGIRVENDLLKGWVSWGTIHSHCCDYES